MIEFNAFTKQDWYGLADAQSFSDGSPPMRADFIVSVDGVEHEAVAVLDAIGLGIMVTDANGDDVMNLAWDSAFGARALTTLYRLNTNLFAASFLKSLPGAVNTL